MAVSFFIDGFKAECKLTASPEPGSGPGPALCPGTGLSGGKDSLAGLRPWSGTDVRKNPAGSTPTLPEERHPSSIAHVKQL